MKKGWKILWIICGAILGLGIIFCIAGGVMGASRSEVAAELGNGITIGDVTVHGLWDSDTSEDWEHAMDYEHGEREENPDSRDSYHGVRELDIDVAGVELQILPSEDKDIHVETNGISSDLKYSCRQDGETLEIETTKKLHLINRIEGHGTVWVYLPEEQLNEIDISNAAGTVYVKNANAREFKLDVGAGAGTIDHFTAQEAELVCGAGELTATGTVQYSADVDCGVGEVNLALAGNEEDYSYEVDCGVGDVTVGGRSFSGIGVDQSRNHHDEYDDEDDDEDEYYDDEHDNETYNGNKYLSIDCGVGSVSVTFTGL